MYELVPQMYSLYLNLFILLIRLISKEVASKVRRLKCIYKVGPQNIDVLSLIFGSLLGEAQVEKEISGAGTRISFCQEGLHVKYILFLHKMFSDLGYCNPKLPVITTRLGGKGKTLKIARFSTWTYTSFNWIHDLWYENRIKRVPECIDKYLTPLALAIWISEKGSKVGKGLNLSTNSFAYNDCLILVKALKDNFNLNASIRLVGAKDQYDIYISQESLEDLRKIVYPYMIPEIKHKII
jgi:ubiquinol-cytochrome c reductase cytochrome b subunit